MNITVWNEFRHEKESELVQKHYPEGIHEVISKFLDGNVTTATLDMPEHGLTDEVLNNTDVLIWWGHKAHDEVQDEIVEKVYKRVLEGMGFIALHSAHFSKVFKKLMGTGCDLKWREAGEKERIWIVNPAHPIAEGLPEYFELEQEEMYGEHFDIPVSDELLFISWFQGGEVFRSGATFTRGNGKIFYFRPGHETYPTYHNTHVQHVIKNAVKWVKPTNPTYPTYGNYQALEDL
ncbi:ThuA domain-containing protein [Macrococcoides canis]|uniref:ThuA domain-containing protein n=1 Tax=Macrococcoides canis TaxID=1855823 RepID=UPI00165E4399|nr:ThuA domain-containing protein [Macrococcus canis]QNR07182.1 trehalose utilization protein ThuA [Macrococcus canis]